MLPLIWVGKALQWTAKQSSNYCCHDGIPIVCAQWVWVGGRVPYPSILCGVVALRECTSLDFTSHSWLGTPLGGAVPTTLGTSLSMPALVLCAACEHAGKGVRCTASRPYPQSEGVSACLPSSCWEACSCRCYNDMVPW